MSCGRWTRNEIFLSNSFLAAAEITDLSYLTCHHFDRNGLVHAVATTGIQKKKCFKGKYPFGKGEQQMSSSDGVSEARCSKKLSTS